MHKLLWAGLKYYGLLLSRRHFYLKSPKNDKNTQKVAKKAFFGGCKKLPLFDTFCTRKVIFRAIIDLKSAKNVSGHRYFLQYPPNLKCGQMAKKYPNNVLFRYPPPPPPPLPPLKGGVWGVKNNTLLALFLSLKPPF